MATATISPSESSHGPGHGGAHGMHAPVTPGKVAMWLFPATEVMFFTGLIGSYIVLRSGSSHTSYSNLYKPTTPLSGLEDTAGILIKSPGTGEAQVEALLHSSAGLSEEAAKKVIEEAPHGLVTGL